MIYKRIKDRLLNLLKAPTHPPDPPAGSSESVHIFRAAPNFLKYQVFVWGGGFAVGVLVAVSLFVFDDDGGEAALGYVHSLSSRANPSLPP